MNLTPYLPKIQAIPTPFYLYDSSLIEQTLNAAVEAAKILPQMQIHYAAKANACPDFLRTVATKGLGADCVSGAEIARCVEAGIDPQKIMFAGVGKTDKEIELALTHNILCFNAESLPEIDVIQSIAARMGVTTNVALRINPNVDAHTHKYITTGLEQNKFGIAMADMVSAARHVLKQPNLRLYGLHFHIGSQILRMNSFRLLCHRIMQLVKRMKDEGIAIRAVNFGGGLGVDYRSPEKHPIPNFQGYFETLRDNISLDSSVFLHCELGRSLTAQWGALITRVVYVKTSGKKQFVVVDAGMNDLIRPALYGAYHKIINLSATTGKRHHYDIVGPVCESSDVFARDYPLPTTRRGDILAILSAGAYGRVMSSGYNCRPLAPEYLTNQL